MVAGKIPLAAPNLGPPEAEYVQQAISSGWVGPDGPFVERFEEMVAKAAGRGWAVATLTGTMALYVGATILGIRGCNVAVPTSAFPAACNVLDELDNDIEEVEGGKNHDCTFYGWSPIPYLADRAPAIGEPPVDALLECYSFAANKTVTCGQGGAVVGDGTTLERAARDCIHQGYGRTGITNGRMANINAALGCAQMERLGELREAKKRIWNRYRDAGLPMVNRGESRWMSTISQSFRNFEEFDVREEMLGVFPSGMPISCMSIPCGTGLTEAEQDTVIRCLTSRT